MSRRRIIRDDDDEIRLADEEPHTEELGGGDEEPSATEQQRLRAEEEAHRRKARELAEKTARLQAELRAAVGQHEQEMNLAKVLSNRQKRLAPDPEPQGAPSAAARKPHQPLQPQVRALIVNSVLDEGMKWSEVSERFKVSKPTISRFGRGEEGALRRGARGDTEKARPQSRHHTGSLCVARAADRAKRRRRPRGAQGGSGDGVRHRRGGGRDKQGARFGHSACPNQPPPRPSPRSSSRGRLYSRSLKSGTRPT